MEGAGVFHNLNDGPHVGSAHLSDEKFLKAFHAGTLPNL
jgi:hypothetical protein